MNSQEIEIKGERLTLLPERAVYWSDKNLLILSDLHLGKAGHFRKHGVPISRNIHLTDLQILESLIQRFKPHKVILLGDLFHSFENNEWQDFLRFMEVYDFVKFTLVEGNHDIISEYPKELKVVIQLNIPPFSFTHIKEDSGYYNLSGHIHPGVQMKGRGRQSMTIPCFTFKDDHGILPAFGQFTGIKKIRPQKEDRVFGVVSEGVIELT
ncbi:MAG: ligase-associated DNA damage response endonuclease PdeM [Ekhidna sp.]|uniref:ligase-associated DNA damage response endonuclease PdeM n=1 Tax=Ekhidna sp. TaxID=2608089 RepID=UPI0032EDF717